MLKILFIIILVFLVVRFLIRFLFPVVRVSRQFKRYHDVVREHQRQQQERQQQNGPRSRQEGDVDIHWEPEKKRASSSKHPSDGEYIDYEEVK